MAQECDKHAIRYVCASESTAGWHKDVHQPSFTGSSRGGGRFVPAKGGWCGEGLGRVVRRHKWDVSRKGRRRKG